VTGLVVGTSAAIGILLSEPERDALAAAIDVAEDRLISPVSVLELGIVLESRFGAAGGALAERFVREAGLDVVPLDRTQTDLALEGWRRFGKGRHPAALNLGDCATYGLAVATALPVLCLGSDFPKTDVEVVPLDR
jgi:ribonuclease VapC